RDAGPTYDPVDPFHPSLPASDAVSGTIARSGDPLTEVSGELSKVIVASPSVIDKVAVVDALATIPYEVAGPAVQTVAASAQLPARLWAISALMTMPGSEQAEGAKVDYLYSVQSTLL